MKRKEIECDAEAMVGSVEALAAHVRGERKLTLRTRAMTLPEPIEPLRPKDVAAIQAEDYVREVRVERLTDGRRNDQ